MPGINGKMSEFNAAFGLLQLKGVDEAIRRRRAVDVRYREGLAAIEGIHCLPTAGEAQVNFAYFPIMVRPEFPLSRDKLYQRLAAANIHGRRYFFPLISDFPMYSNLPSAAPANLPVARAASNSILCLPMSSNLELDDVDRVVSCIADARRA